MKILNKILLFGVILISSNYNTSIAGDNVGQLNYLIDLENNLAGNENTIEDNMTVNYSNIIGKYDEEVYQSLLNEGKLEYKTIIEKLPSEITIAMYDQDKRYWYIENKTTQQYDIPCIFVKLSFIPSITTTANTEYTVTSDNKKIKCTGASFDYNAESNTFINEEKVMGQIITYDHDIYNIHSGSNLDSLFNYISQYSTKRKEAININKVKLTINPNVKVILSNSVGGG